MPAHHKLQAANPPAMDAAQNRSSPPATDTTLTLATPLTIVLDEQPHTLPGACTLAELVERLGHAPTAVATALNGRFVPRGSRGVLALAEGDAVLLFQPIVGG
jgi:sulfur carrier protein